MDSNFAMAHLELGLAFVQKHMYAEAIAELQRAIKLSDGCITCASNLAYAYALSGRRSEALTLLNELKNRSRTNAPEIALIYVGLGEKEQAMIWLEKAYAERFNPSILLRPGFDPLRSDSRFQNLVQRIGLPVLVSLAELKIRQEPRMELSHNLAVGTDRVCGSSDAPSDEQAGVRIPCRWVP